MKRSLRTQTCLPSLLSGLGVSFSRRASFHTYSRLYRVYVRSYDGSPNERSWRGQSTWDVVAGAGGKPDKVYLETFRDGVIPDKGKIVQAKQFFRAGACASPLALATVANERKPVPVALLPARPADPAEAEGSRGVHAGLFTRSSSTTSL